jgi:hypothetical protein
VDWYLLSRCSGWFSVFPRSAFCCGAMFRHKKESECCIRMSRKLKELITFCIYLPLLELNRLHLWCLWQVFCLRFCCQLMNLLHGRTKSRCVDFALFVGSLDIPPNAITGSIVSTNSKFEMWNVMMSASRASCVRSATTTHFFHCTAYSWRHKMYLNSCCCDGHDCLMACKSNTTVTEKFELLY